MMNVNINIDNSGVIYFTSDSQNPSEWHGNVYKVTSVSSAQELVGSSNTWLTFPQDIAFDDFSNPVVSYAKYISETSAMEVHLAVLENDEWKEISGDFTNHISPVDIESNNNGVYFVFGDGNDVTNGYPKLLKADLFFK